MYACTELRDLERLLRVIRKPQNHCVYSGKICLCSVSVACVISLNFDLVTYILAIYYVAS